MSIDALQNKIRKKKNPVALTISPMASQIPAKWLEDHQGDAVKAAGAYCRELLTGLKDVIPAVRVNPGAFALLGSGGMEEMTAVLETAKELGYYVILDWLRLETPEEAKSAAELIFKQERFPCDAVTLCGYAGTDCLKPWFKAAGKDKDVYVVVKTANKSGSELQDVQTGGRMLFTASADLVGRLGETAMERCGYSRYAVMAGANSAGSLKTLRERYPKLFVMVDGLDGTGGNAKIASAAFDRVGHGALVCVSGSVFAAWQESEGEGEKDPITAAREAAERVKRNLARYVTVL